MIRFEPKKAVAIACLAGSFVALLLFLHRFSVGDRSLWWQAVLNAGHAPLFGTLAIIMLRMSQLVLGCRLGCLTPYLLAWCGAVVLGAGSEYLQIATSRDADLVDWLRDIVGATAFLSLYFSFDSHLIGKLLKVRDRARLALRILAVSLLIGVMIPVAVSAAAYWHRDRSFPVISGFDYFLERELLDITDATLEFADPPDEWIGPNSPVAHVTFNPSEYPTLYFEEPFPDWRGYQKLIIDLYCPVDTGLQLYVTVHDRQYPAYHNRYNGVFTLQPGATSLSVPLTDIANGPRDRQLDLSSIEAIHMFIISPPEPLVLYFDNVRLE